MWTQTRFQRKHKHVDLDDVDDNGGILVHYLVVVLVLAALW